MVNLYPSYFKFLCGFESTFENASEMFTNADSKPMAGTSHLTPN